ncbi:hypothetical protein PMAYCL1PPCAC_09718, partial [Pristionchus mayeri]
AVLQIISTLIVLLTAPLNARLISVLLSSEASKSLQRSFRVMQLNITMLNIIYSTYHLTVLDLAWFGLATDFFMEQRWTAYIGYVVAVVFQLGTKDFQLMIAINQM